MILDTTRVGAIDWDTPGKRLYHVPFTQDGNWARERLPLAVICADKPGKTLLAIGGTHGNEFEGPVGIKNLIQELDASSLVSGRVVAVPTLNVPAFRAGQRSSPLDGGNMNRAFPGDANGSITSRIARFVSDELLERADIVVDIHAAGMDHEIARCVSFHELESRDLQAATMEAAYLFGMPFVWIYTAQMGTGLLTSYAESLGKLTLGGEFGFGEGTEREGVARASGGLKNVMRLHGLLPGPIEDLLPKRCDRVRLVQSTDIEKWMTAPVSGIFEPIADLGTFVRHGQPVARIHSFERFDEPGVEIAANADGYLMQRQFRSWVTQGSVVAVVGEEVGMVSA